MVRLCFRSGLSFLFLLAGVALAQPTPSGSPFLVSSTLGVDSLHSDVAAAPDGGFAVAWDVSALFGDPPDGSGAAVKLLRYAPNGATSAGPFFVNTYTTNNQQAPRLAFDSGGRLLVVWESWEQDGDGAGVFGRLFDANSAPEAAEFLVNAYTTGSQGKPVVSNDPTTGEFVVAWTSVGQDGDGAGVFARRFDGAGLPAGDEFQVNEYTTALQANPAISQDSEGNFVIAWSSEGQDGSGSGVFARRFSGGGQPLGPEFAVNASGAGEQGMPSVSHAPDDRFVIVWSSDDPNAPDQSGIYARLYDRQGNPDAPIRVAEAGVSTLSPAYVSHEPQGRFVVSWKAAESLSGFVRGQVFSRHGTPEGGEFQIAEGHAYLHGGRLTHAPDGSMLVTWQNFVRPTFDVQARRYEPLPAFQTPAPPSWPLVLLLLLTRAKRQNPRRVKGR